MIGELLGIERRFERCDGDHGGVFAVGVSIKLKKSNFKDCICYASDV